MKFASGLYELLVFSVLLIPAAPYFSKHGFNPQDLLNLAKTALNALF